jgi:uncharacterized delta-60 repeat protein
MNTKSGYGNWSLTMCNKRMLRVALALLLVPMAAGAGGPPQVWTSGARGVTANAAALNGTVNPDGYAAAAWFQWGTTANYGNLTSMTDMGSGTNALPLSARLAGLTAGVTYHFRVAATNSAGAGYGSDQVFTTPVHSATPSDVDLAFNANPSFRGPNCCAPDQFISTIRLWEDGRVLVGGFFSLTNTSQFVGIARLNPDGSLDNSFLCTTAPPVSAIAVQPDGKILIGGGAYQAPNFTRLNPDGSFDGTFLGGQGGVAGGADHAVRAIAVQGDGKILLGGWFESVDGISQTNLARLDANGSFDAAFRPRLDHRYSVTSVAVQPDGKILFAGDFNSVNEVARHGVARLNPDGTLDAFDPSITPDTRSDFDRLVRLLLQPDGRILIYGDFSAVSGVTRKYLARLNADGSLDSSFFPDPFIIEGPEALALQCDGKILIGGATAWLTNNSFARLNPDGSLDQSFLVEVYGASLTPAGNAIAQLLDGKILAAGWFNSVGGVNRTNIVRLMGDYAPLTVLRTPCSLTVEQGSSPSFTVTASGYLPPAYQWFFNGTNALTGCMNWCLELTNAQPSDCGAYSVVMTNATGAITSGPAMLNVIPPVGRRSVPGVQLMGEAGSLLSVDAADSLSPAPNWTTLGSAKLGSTSQYYFDLSEPLPSQRFYRAWQTGTPSALPSLSPPGMVPAITLTGSIGDSLRLDYINQFGPIDAWVTLDTVRLTNTSQLYFDTSAPGQPTRLYRLVPVP